MADPPYLFVDFNDNPAGLRPAGYVVGGRTYRFPPGHRLAGDRSSGAMEPMWRDLLRLFVRLDYDLAAFRSFLAHGIRELVLPFTSVHVKMTGGWVYPNGDIHTGVDFNDEPQGLHPYADHPHRTNFEVVAAAGGTIVGWDETKLLTLEHVSSDGRLFRTIYNMMRNVPVGPVSPGGIIELGRPISAGQPIGEAWDPPGNPIHLHFGMVLPHRVATAWTPNLTPLFGELSAQFSLDFTPSQQAQILSNWPSANWPEIEWFFVDPFGLYDISRASSANYGPVGRGFYYPVPAGVGTFAFRDEAIGGDPGGERIPLFAGHRALLDGVSVQPLALATLAAVSE